MSMMAFNIVIVEVTKILRLFNNSEWPKYLEGCVLVFDQFLNIINEKKNAQR